MPLHVQRRTVMVMVLVVLVGVFVMSLIIEPKAKFSIEERLGQDLAGLPGKIGLRIRTKENNWAFIIADRELVSKPDLIDGPKEAKTITALREGFKADFLGEDVISRGPYLVSPDKSYIVLSIAYRKAKSYGPTDVIVANLKIDKVVFQRKQEPVRFIDGIAWSPDSHLCAVLEHSYQRVLSLRSFISALAGHPVSSKIFYVVIYDLRGKLIAQAKVASGVIGGWGELVWF